MFYNILILPKEKSGGHHSPHTVECFVFACYIRLCNTQLICKCEGQQCKDIECNGHV